jgi:hypothetical protein
MAAFASSYIPTVASQVTRNADAVSMTGSNFTSWYRPDEGALYAEFSTASPSSTSGVFVANDNTGANRVELRNESSVSRLTSVQSSVSQANIFAGAIPAVGAFSKLAGAYKLDNFAASANGANAGIDSSGTVPTVTQARIGAVDGGSNFLNGHIRKVSYYPQRISNAALQALTS